MASAAKRQRVPRTPKKVALSDTEKINARLVESGRRKLDRGGTPTSREAESIKRAARRANNDELRRILRAIPKWLYCELSGRQTSLLNRQADQYGLSLRGKVNLFAVIRGFHDLLAKHAKRLAAPEGVEDGMVGPNSPWLEKFREEQTLLARLNRKEREGSLLPRSAVHEMHAELARLLRGFGTTLQRQYGTDALDLLNELMTNYGRWAERWITDHQEDDEQAKASK